MKRSFSVRRVAVAVLVAALVLGGGAWYAVHRLRAVSYRPANSIMVLMPYRYAGTWVFDDERVGLHREPFVAGIPEMMDELVQEIPDADKGFRLLFSTQPFPGYSHKLVWRRGDKTGNYYYCEKLRKEGWLCPGLFKYYQQAPREIYVKAEPK